MSKIAVVYWSGTGNTEVMAYYVAEGAGAVFAYDSVMCTDSPDAEAVRACKALGEALN